MLFWISWVQPTEDYRPLHFPPNERVLGWWCSGHTDSGANLCAAVSAQDFLEAKKAIMQDWPEAGREDWRFCEAREPNWRPGDRFPLSDWMVERFDKPR